MHNSNINFFILLFVSFIYVPLSIVSGLALAPLLVILGFVSIFNGQFSNGRFSFIKQAMNKNYNTFLFALFLLAFLTSLSSVNVDYSFVSLAKIGAVFLCGFAAIYNNKPLDENYKKILAMVFIAGYSLGIVIMSIELLSDGVLTKALRFIINQEEFTEYKTHSLNRGACILALSFWIFIAAINYLNINKKTYIAICYWFILMFIMMVQDSSSAKLSFVFSSLVFSFFLISRCKFLRLYIILFLLFILLLPLFFLAVPAKVIYNDFPNMPDSMVHRMVIWNFSMQKMYEKHYLGWGFNASRYIPGALEPVKAIINEERMWKRMPNHPHNFAIQVGVELGIFGFLFLIAYITVFMHSVRIYEKNLFRKNVQITIVTSYLIISFFAFSIWQEWWISSAFIVATIYSAIFRKQSNIGDTENVEEDAKKAIDESKNSKENSK